MGGVLGKGTKSTKIFFFKITDVLYQMIKSTSILHINLFLKKNKIWSLFPALTPHTEEQVTTISKKRCIDSSQIRIDKFYESDKIDNAKQALYNRAVAKFFICCGVAFHLVSHP